MGDTLTTSTLEGIHCFSKVPSLWFGLYLRYGRGISWNFLGPEIFLHLANGQRGSTLAPVTPSDTAPWRWMLDVSLGWESEDVFWDNVDCRLDIEFYMMCNW